VKRLNKAIRELLLNIFEKIKNLVVNYEDLLKLLFVAILTKGHILIEGPPGTGKTTIAKLFACSIGGSFKRIQMTPDLLPADIIGSYYYDIKKSEWVLKQGPIFTNVLFIDELNRASPRTQSALLEAMQEKQVTIEGTTIYLPKIFLVIATQMPVGSEGTYPLTPTLMDRFAYFYTSSYSRDEVHEISIILKSEELEKSYLSQIIDLDTVSKMGEEVMSIYVSEKVLRYIARIVMFLRNREDILIPPSPRASIWLYRGGKAVAYLEGVEYVTPDHIKWIARFVLPHRIHLKPHYIAEGVKPQDIVEEVLKSVEVPK
jgi:MoxR-like ATPase